MRCGWYHSLRMSLGTRAPSLFLSHHLQSVAPTLRVTRCRVHLWASHLLSSQERVRTKDKRWKSPASHHFWGGSQEFHQWLPLASLTNTGSQDCLELQGRMKDRGSNGIYCYAQWSQDHVRKGSGKLMLGGQQLEEHCSCCLRRKGVCVWGVTGWWVLRRASVVMCSGCYM